ncbi:MAG: preprotein translocase subunit SecA [Candidatus Promineifilaceae bacterium]
MFKRLLKRILGDPNDKIMEELKLVVDEVAELEPSFAAKSDDELRAETEKLRERAVAGEDLEDLLVESFALVREASKRTTGLRHYDVQIMGGVLIHRRNVVEMRTGEGKTLVATGPIFLNALSGDGVHLVTVNEYLVKRDGGWMGQIFTFLGMTVGCIGPNSFSGTYDADYVNPGAELEDERLVHWRPATRKEAYAADVTYGTASEFGFDYLRDNMVTNKARLVQRGHNMAIIDEVDNILIDESRTPLIISGPAPRTGKEYSRFSDYVRRLKENMAHEDDDPDGHYDIDHKSNSVSLTDLGVVELEKRITEIDTDNGDTIYDPRFYHLTYYLDNAMKAQYLFHRDKEYMVREGQVVIIDQTTGRAMPSRRYSDGLHEAIEAKEKVEIQRETTTVATITLQNYFRMYANLAGMTGTALTDAEEFDKIYELGVFPLPTNVQYIVDSGNRGLVEKNVTTDGTKEIFWVDPKTGETAFHKRTDFADQVYGSLDSKDRAIVNEVKKYHAMGRPVLVGTTSVEHSEKIGRLLKQDRVTHNVLNAKIHQSEALVVGQAGRKGAVTISTNMAGRGTDILLGGNAEGLAAGALEEELFDRSRMINLAQIWLVKGAGAAREAARRDPKLDAELVDGLITIKKEFDAALVQIEQVQLTTYLAQRMAAEFNVEVGVARQTVTYVRLGAVNQARQYLVKENVDTALAEEAVRLFELYNKYQAASGDNTRTAQFLGEMLFEQHYQARAAVIRAVMNDEMDEAREVVTQVPGLSDNIVERVVGIKQQTLIERKDVWATGGLHVIGSERHESRRVDNQLRGRAARQGDPGSSRFFLSVEDELMLRFGGERLQNFMNRFEIPEDMPIENRMIDRLIASSQERLEGYNFDIRKNLVEYDDVMAKQREAMYRDRRDILLSETADLDGRIASAFNGVVNTLADNYLDNYHSFMRENVDRTVTEYSTDATDDVNLRAVLVRLRSLVPGLMTLNQELEGKSPQQTIQRIMKLVDENEEKGQNVYQLLQSMRSFVPLLPQVPNVAANVSSRRDRLSSRESLRRGFMTALEELYNEFLAQHMDAGDRESVWRKAQTEINDAFVRFNVEGASIDALKAQQDKFKIRVDDALAELLLDGLNTLDSDQLVEALSGHIKSQADKWRERIGDEEYRAFQRLLLLNAFDREWRDYLTAMDDLRREVGLQAFGQRDPKVEYKKRSFEMFQDMRNNINEYVAKGFFEQIDRHQQYVQQQERKAAQSVAAANQAAAVKAGGSSNRAGGGYTVVKRGNGRGTVVKREQPKLGRNDVCWCGSGKKYKSCHFKEDQKKNAGGGIQAAPAKKRAVGGKKKRRR